MSPSNLPYRPHLTDQTHWLAFVAGVQAVTSQASPEAVHEAFTTWTQLAKREIAESTLPHQYTSTACQHSLHDKCRLVCKYCGIECACSCHDIEVVTNPVVTNGG